MQEFFMDYGLWLLVALLVVIALVFLLSGKKKADGPVESVAPVVAPPEPAAVPPVPLMAEPAAIAPLVEPQPAEPVPAIIEPALHEPAPPEPTIIEPAIEPATAVAESEAVPVSPAVTTPATPEDDLLKLKGVGPKLKALLIDLGVTRFAQIAVWTDSDVVAIDTKLGNFKGRPVRDQWIDQAKYLAAGDIAGFEAKYGKL